MITPAVKVRPIDRVRAIRAILTVRQTDQVGLNEVAREAAADTNPESVAQLVLALAEMAASFLRAIPDGDTRLQQILLNYAKDN
ncbi:MULTISPECIES: hypothetical protein [unclassified Arthrobacter]|uniref:hypothetical protein n=1 Tax=unclassified Arthrobacter TaxID=235627 RepID=UPI001C848A8B|nr:hypothetical protein [Arthrobacter sp. MAHUQ-56]MBX7445456.1 hypothetical protein [Arthrobacter sp. MAHUQ-56]